MDSDRENMHDRVRKAKENLDRHPGSWAYGKDYERALLEWEINFYWDYLLRHRLAPFFRLFRPRWHRIGSS